MRLVDADAMTESLEYDIELDARALDNTELVGAERERIQFDKDCKQNCVWYLTEQPTVDAVPSEELFNLFTTITSAEYGKQRFFVQKDGTVYDRHKGDYLHNFDLAVVRFCNELSDY